MFGYENSNLKTYLVYKLEQNDTIDSIALGMIANNSIPSFLPAVFSQIDNDKYIKYDITSKIQASQVFSGTVNRKFVFGLINGIIEATTNSYDYMINTNAIILDLERIFIEISSGKAYVVCLPLENSSEMDLLTFFKKLMFESRFDQNENCDYIAKIINYLNSVSSFSARDFKEFIQAISTNTPAGNPANVVKATAPVQPVSQPINNYGAINNQNTSQVAAPPVQNVQVQTQRVQNTVARNSMNIPNNQNVQVPQTNNVPVKEKKVKNNNSNKTEVPNVQQDEGKKMSMFYLLSHYSKENAAIYKSQKNQPVAEMQNAPIQAKPVNEKKDKKARAQQETNFAIPGVAVPVKSAGGNNGAPISTPPINRASANPVQVNNQNTNTVPVNSNPMVHQQVVQPAVQPVQNQQVNYVQNNSGMNYQAQNYQAQSFTAPPANTDFGETTVLGGGTDGETTVLSDFGADAQAISVKQPFIIRMSNNEKISVNKPVFRIGKERSYVDYFIGDNSYISRGHANIISRDGRYFIVDNNSRNHTFVNGDIITSSTEVELKSGDTFKLANEAFEFKLF